VQSLWFIWNVTLCNHYGSFGM